MDLGRQMTLLGLIALAYYGLLLASGVVSADVMPQFVVSAIIFLSSGRLLRKVKPVKIKKKDDDQEQKKVRKEHDWGFYTQVLNWIMALGIIAVLALWVLKPVGVPFSEFLPW